MSAIDDVLDDPMSDLVAFNGVDGTTGDYIIPPLTPAEASALLASLAPGWELDEARAIEEEDVARDAEEACLDQLSDAGYAVLFGRSVGDDVREALKPLLRARASECGDGLYRELGPEIAALAAAGRTDRLEEELGITPGAADPEQFPYYLLIVGDATDVPFDVQHELGAERAIGRLDLGTAAAHARYVESVLAAESGRTDRPRARRLEVFAPANVNDPATNASSTRLATPVAAEFAKDWHASGWTVERSLRFDATRSRLETIVREADRPGIVFTASHGVYMPNGHALQSATQGALVCQEWIRGAGRDVAAHAFRAEDVPDDADVAGSAWMSFACFGAGTPSHNEFAATGGQRLPQVLAGAPFVSELPKRLLSHEKGGALAFIGHVERAWTCSFQWGTVTQDHRTFSAALNRIASGMPVGHALTHFGRKYANYAVKLSQKLKPRVGARAIDPHDHGRLWTALTDARNFVLLGDPAARLTTR